MSQSPPTRLPILTRGPNADSTQGACLMEVLLGDDDLTLAVTEPIFDGATSSSAAACSSAGRHDGPSPRREPLDDPRGRVTADDTDIAVVADIPIRARRALRNDVVPSGQAIPTWFAISLQTFGAPPARWR